MNNDTLTFGKPGQEITVDLNEVRAIAAAIEAAPEKELSEKLNAALGNSSLTTPNAPYELELAGPGEAGV